MSIEVPKLNRAQLFDRVATLNQPLSDDRSKNPLSGPTIFIHTENPGLAEWASYVGGSVNQGMGGSDNRTTIEKRVFDNSFIAAYDLICHGYRENGLELPTIATPSDGYSWLGFTALPNLGQLFQRYNERQKETVEEYYDYAEALQTWASESVMAFTTPNRVGMTAIAGAEVYLSFRDNQI
jgi:hypothetical protein